MAGVMFTIWLLGCAKAPPPEVPPRPTLGVAVPLSGANAAVGAAALDAVVLAAGDEVDVLAVDDTIDGAAERLAAVPQVIGVVAHVTRRSAEAQAESWLRTDLPVVVAAPGDFRGLPRVVPPIETSARCAAVFLAEDFWVRTDGSTPGMVAARTLMDTSAHSLGMDTVDPAHAASQAAKTAGRSDRTVAWTGEATAGGNFLRALRQVGSRADFLGVGLYDPRFLDAAGAAAEGVRVTSEGRPARDRAFVDAYVARHGVGPIGAAVDAYEASVLLLSAWRSASRTAASLTRADVTSALSTVVAEGANGPMYLGADGVLQPVFCATFVVRDGVFEVERIVSEADAMLAEPTPKKKKRRR